MTVNSLTIGDYRCFIANSGCCSPVVYCGIQANKDDFHLLLAQVKSLVVKDFSLVCFSVNDWNAQFSPWRASNVFATKSFAGNGDELLSWLNNSCIPLVEQQIAPSSRYIAGYSLAGLFSLYAALKTSNIFKGVASCSGSLWYPHWLDFLSASTPQLELVYLSIGDKESVTKNSMLQSVVPCTKATYNYFLSSSTSKPFFEFNAGGHFDNTSERLAKGIAWLINNS